MSENEMRERLREFPIAEIKKIIRKHNLHSHIKLGQKKEALIENIIMHYKSTGDGSVLQMKHQDEIKLDDYTPTKDVITVKKYNKGAGDRMRAEKNKRADDVIQVLNKIKSDKSATDKVVSDAKAEIELLREAKAVRNKRDAEIISSFSMFFVCGIPRSRGNGLRHSPVESSSSTIAIPGNTSLTRPINL